MSEFVNSYVALQFCYTECKFTIVKYEMEA